MLLLRPIKPETISNFVHFENNKQRATELDLFFDDLRSGLAH